MCKFAVKVHRSKLYHVLCKKEVFSEYKKWFFFFKSPYRKTFSRKSKALQVGTNLANI